MKLLLIRHAESEHNVQGLLAGITDSALTNHGIFQTQKLGQYLVKQAYNIAEIFSSDLRRARLTAEAVQREQTANTNDDQVQLPGLTSLTVLREQDFGSHELKPWASKLPTSETDRGLVDANQASFKEKESRESMAARCDLFLDDHLLPLMHAHIGSVKCVAIVSHGLILASLWKCLLLRFSPQTISLGPDAVTASGFRPLEYLPSWSNTGYLELDIVPDTYPPNADEKLPSVPVTDSSTPSAVHWRVTVVRVNCVEHLKNLKRTRGGLGSATYDSRQRKLEGFFHKKPKMNNGTG